ncbi:MAG: PIN domain-containing protein [Planctomycetia bacterium]|nr:PIN domain-containing protein [Planctomycetia bacterium]
MILVDTSVLIDYLRTGDPKIDGLFRTLPVAVCGITSAELLHGVRSSAERTRILTILAAFTQVAIPDSIWNDVGDNLNALRAGGVTIPFADAVIATVAITNDVELWTRDNHFAHVQRILPALKLFVEPP